MDAYCLIPLEVISPKPECQQGHALDKGSRQGSFPTSNGCHLWSSLASSWHYSNLCLCHHCPLPCVSAARFPSGKGTSGWGRAYLNPACPHFNSVASTKSLLPNKVKVTFTGSEVRALTYLLEDKILPALLAHTDVTWFNLRVFGSLISFFKRMWPSDGFLGTEKIRAIPSIGFKAQSHASFPHHSPPRPLGGLAALLWAGLETE